MGKPTWIPRSRSGAREDSARSGKHSHCGNVIGWWLRKPTRPGFEVEAPGRRAWDERYKRAALARMAAATYEDRSSPWRSKYAAKRSSAVYISASAACMNGLQA